MFKCFQIKCLFIINVILVTAPLFCLFCWALLIVHSARISSTSKIIFYLLSTLGRSATPSPSRHLAFKLSIQSDMTCESINFTLTAQIGFSLCVFCPPIVNLTWNGHIMFIAARINSARNAFCVFYWWLVYCKRGMLTRSLRAHRVQCHNLIALKSFSLNSTNNRFRTTSKRKNLCRSISRCSLTFTFQEIHRKAEAEKSDKWTKNRKV